MNVKLKILLTVSGVLLVSVIGGILFVNYEISAIMKSNFRTANNKMLESWQAESRGLFSRYHKLLDVYQEIALGEAAFFANDKNVLKAYEVANSGDLQDENDAKSKEARRILKRSFSDNLAGLERYNKWATYKLHFHTLNARSLARIWQRDWQVIRDGEKLDITDDISSFRNTIHKVRSIKDTVAGIEVGRSGLVVRGICPILNHEGEYEGSVELLIPHSDVTKSLSSNPRINHAVYIPKHFLKISESLRDTSMFPMVGDSYVRVNTTDDAVFSSNKVTSKVLDKIKHELKYEMIDGNFISAVTIKDFNGEDVGQFVIAINVEDDIRKNLEAQQDVYSKAESFKLYLLIGCMVTLMVIVLIINLFLGRILSKLKQTTHRMKESEDRFRGLFTHMLEGFALHEIILNDDNVPVDYRFLLVNSAFEEQTGLKQNDIVGRTVLEVLPNTESTWIEKYGKVALTQKPMRFDQYSQELDMHFEVYAFSPKSGQFACVSRDITEKKKLDHEKLKRQEELLYSEKMRVVGQLAGGVAHDLNNKLCAIIGGAEMLQTELGGNGNNKYLDMILQAAESSADLAQKLLTFGNKNFLPFCKINAIIVLREALYMIKEKLPAKVSIKEYYNADYNIVNGDSSQLFSSFINIGLNASQAIVDAGVITISTSNIEVYKKSEGGLEPGTYLRIEFTDDGEGISEDNMTKIFEPFFSTRGVKSGLGLPSVLGTMQHHNGNVKVDSKIGKGTTVVLLLPCVEQAVSF